MKASLIIFVTVSGLAAAAGAAPYVECLDASIGRSLEANGCALRDGRALIGYLVSARRTCAEAGVQEILGKSPSDITALAARLAQVANEKFESAVNQKIRECSLNGRFVLNPDGLSGSSFFVD